MRQRLLEVYERELSYLRQMGGEFAARYPGVAGHLLLEPHRCADPHVERLLEAFSFLAARIHLRLEDDLPELTEGFLDVVYPHYLRPIPAMTIAEFRLNEQYASSTAPMTVATGAELRTRQTVEGMPCRFRTGYSVDLWPVEVVECTWERPEKVPSPPRVPDAVAVVRLRLRGRGERPLAQLGMVHLNLYLAAEKGVALPLYELLSRNVIEVLARDPESPANTTVSLGPHAFRPMGFKPEEALLPYTPRSFQGYQLLQEYFAFPEKFLFFELVGLESAARAMPAQGVEFLIYISAFDQPERWQAMEFGVSAQTLRLGCTPIVNFFEQTAEPILVTQTRHEYPVSPSSRYDALMELYSVERVTATNPSRRTSTVLHPLFEHHFGTARSGQVFWRTRRETSMVDDRRLARTQLSIVDRNGALTAPESEILTVHATCTNANLPSKLSFGDEGGDFEIDGATAVGTIRALHRPTMASDAPAGAGQVWSLISQLSLNHLSLGEQGLPALREILRLHNFSGATHLNKQIDGLVAMTAKQHLAVMEGEFGSVAARGIRLEVLLEEENFAGGGAYLFAAVLDRFFGLYVSMNSFSQLVVRTDLRKEVLGAWPPRAGRQMVL